MAKKPSTFFNMVLTLFVITLISSAALGIVYEKTKGPIAKVALNKKTKAIAQVVPKFDNDPLKDSHSYDVKGGTVTIYAAKQDGKPVGFAVETFTLKGFSGLVKLMVGLLSDGSIDNIVVLEASETPGLGDKIRKDKSNFRIDPEK